MVLNGKFSDIKNDLAVFKSENFNKKDLNKTINMEENETFAGTTSVQSTKMYTQDDSIFAPTSKYKSVSRKFNSVSNSQTIKQANTSLTGMDKDITELNAM